MPSCTRRAALVSTLAVCLIAASLAAQPSPAGGQEKAEARRIVRTPGAARGALPPTRSGAGHWPSFRGLEATGVADGQQLPDDWNPATGANILWRLAVPGLAHSSPIVWGDTLFVTSAISSRRDATFKPGLYGNGDASEDRSAHRWMLYAIDKRTGRIRWERLAVQAEPRNKRHIKSTYASSSPATDGRIVVAWFGSQGIHAYDFDGGLRWSVDLGRVNMGAYDDPVVRVGPGQLADHLEWPGDRAVRHADRLVPAGAECRDGRHRLEDGSAGTAVVGNADDREHERGSRADHQRVELRARLRSENRPRAVASWRQFEDHRADTDLRQWPAHRGQRPRARATGVRRASRRARRPDARSRRHGEQVHRLEQDRPWLVHANAARLSRDVVCPGQQRRVRCVRRHDRKRGLSPAAAARGQRIQRFAGRRGRQDLSLQRGRRDARHRSGRNVRSPRRRTRSASR